MIRSRFIFLFGILGNIGFANAESKKVLSLEAYLEQVQSGNKGIQASKANVSANELKKEEAQLLLTPQIFANLQNVYDRSETLNPAAQGNRLNSLQYSLGVQQQTDFGTTAKLTYAGAYTSLSGTNPAVNPTPKFFDSKPVLEVSQALWKNAHGEEVKSTLALAKAQYDATYFSEIFKVKMQLAQAEGTFWRLVMARQIVEVQKQTLERAQRIKDWNLRRVRSRLGDKSDFLQAQAATQFRELELQSARDEENAASREFNSWRGVDGSTVTEALPEIDTSTIHEFETHRPSAEREDVKAAKVSTQLAEANAAMGINRNKPTLDAYTSLGLNGHDAEFWEATGETLGGKHPYFVLGIRFNMPLDMNTSATVREGYSRDIFAAQLAYERKREDVERELTNLTAQLNETRKRLKLSRQIESIQSEKLNNERDKFGRGRSTTYQVLNFEQDFATAQLTSLRIQAEYLRLLAQLKTFGGAL